MTKKQILGFSGGVLFIAAICAFIVIYSANRTNQIEPTPFEIEDNMVPQASFEILNPASSKTGDVQTPKVSPIKKESPQVIPDETEKKVDPSKDTIEIKDGNGETVQTHDWAAQKELAEDAVVDDPDNPPEDKTPTQTPDAGNNSAPKNGDTKVIDGEKYGYVEGFGWVKDGGANVGIEVDAPTTGNIVGH